MGIIDRDYSKQNNFKLKFNESKGEIELDDTVNFKNSQTHNNPLNIKDEIKQFNEIAKTKRKIKAIEKSFKPQKKFSFLPWIMAIVVILIIANIINKSNTLNNKTNSFSSVTSDLTTSNRPIKQNLEMPSTAMLLISYSSSSANCPLRLIANDKNYYIKLSDTMRGDKTVAKFFLKAKEELTLKVPVGSYKIKYGSGNEQYGEKELFGRNSQYGESEILNFSFDGYSFQGHTISFYNTVAGNLKTNNVSRDYVAKD